MERTSTPRLSTVIYIFSFIFCMLMETIVSAQPTVTLVPVTITGGDALDAPIQLVNAGDGTNRIFVVQQGTIIKVYDENFNYLNQFLTVSGVNAGGERGLLSMAFHPDYENNGFFYVYYTNTQGSLELARYHVSGNANAADASSKKILITIPHPGETNHNGGELHFGSDGYLYLSTGDGGGGGDQSNNAQNTNSLLGKMLRFNVNTSNTAPYYTIPAGNPYGNEIFYVGFRNPFRWSFDSENNDMWIGDVGQDSWEEINYRANTNTGGANFGWRCYEGNNTYNTSGCTAMSNYVFPAHTYATQNPAAAITGGVVYRGTQYPALQGYYIAADFYSGTFYKISRSGANMTTYTQTSTYTYIADFGETENKEIFAVSLVGNAIYRVTGTGGGPVPVTLVEFGGNVVSDGVRLNWRTTMEQNLDRFDIEYSNEGTSFNYLASVTGQNNSLGYNYSVLDNANRSGIIFYRLKIINRDGSYQYSNTIRIALNGNIKNTIAPSIVSDGLVHVNLSTAMYNSVEVIGMDGKLALRQNIKGRSGDIKVPVTNVARGMYVVRLTGDGETMVQKIIIQ